MRTGAVPLYTEAFTNHARTEPDLLEAIHAKVQAGESGQAAYGIWHGPCQRVVSQTDLLQRSKRQSYNIPVCYDRANWLNCNSRLPVPYSLSMHWSWSQ